MEHSFSLEFNPLTNVKSVKDYEKEIQKLRAENFELKTHLTHSNPSSDNLPKILYEQNEKVTRLEQEKNELGLRLDETKRALERANQDKMIIENKYSQDIFTGNEKMGLLQDENKRLILRMERLNKELADAPQMKRHVQEKEKQNEDYKNFIQNLKAQIEQLKHDFNTQTKDYEDRISDYENKIQEYKINIEQINERMQHMNNRSISEEHEKNNEIENLKMHIDSLQNKNNNNNLIISDLKNSLTNEIKEKQRLNLELAEIKNKKEHVETEFMKNGTAIENYENKITNLESYFSKIQKESFGYLNGMEKFKDIIKSKISGILECVINLNSHLENVKKACIITPENKNFLNKIKVEGQNVNQIIQGVKEIIVDLHRKIQVFKNEANNATFFAENNKNAVSKKTLKLLEAFNSQFTEAKNELIFCKKYLERKAEENKILKNENARLLKQARNTIQMS